MTNTKLAATCEHIVKTNVYLRQNEVVYALLEKDVFTADDIQNLHELNEDGDEEPKAILQWVAVSDWLADKLLEQQEAVIKNEYGTWWGRCTAGQSIDMDSVIEAIAGGNDE